MFQFKELLKKRTELKRQVALDTIADSKSVDCYREISNSFTWQNVYASSAPRRVQSFLNQISVGRCRRLTTLCSCECVSEGTLERAKHFFLDCPVFSTFTGTLIKTS